MFWLIMCILCFVWPAYIVFANIVDWKNRDSNL